MLTETIILAGLTTGSFLYLFKRISDIWLDYVSHSHLERLRQNMDQKIDTLEEKIINLKYSQKKN